MMNQIVMTHENVARWRLAADHIMQVDFPVNDDPAGMLEDSNAGIPAGPHAAAGKSRPGRPNSPEAQCSAHEPLLLRC